MRASFPGRAPMDDPLGPNALDFWVGRWMVSWAGGGHGTNTVRRILDDRVIEESFDGHEGDSSFRGRSLSVRDVTDGRWRQTWVDSSGAYLDFTGVQVEGRIGFQREVTRDGVAVTQRMIWRDVTPDTFLWQWQRSQDAGTSWEVIWEIDYRRA